MIGHQVEEAPCDKELLGFIDEMRETPISV
jgi:hypothetical protein